MATTASTMVVNGAIVLQTADSVKQIRALVGALQTLSGPLTDVGKSISALRPAGPKVFAGFISQVNDLSEGFSKLCTAVDKGCLSKLTGIQTQIKPTVDALKQLGEAVNLQGLDKLKEPINIPDLAANISQAIKFFNVLNNVEIVPKVNLTSVTEFNTLLTQIITKYREVQAASGGAFGQSTKFEQLQDKLKSQSTLVEKLTQDYKAVKDAIETAQKTLATDPTNTQALGSLSLNRARLREVVEDSRAAETTLNSVFKKLNEFKAGLASGIESTNLETAKKEFTGIEEKVKQLNSEIAGFAAAQALPKRGNTFASNLSADIASVGSQFTLIGKKITDFEEKVKQLNNAPNQNALKDSFIEAAKASASARSQIIALQTTINRLERIPTLSSFAKLPDADKATYTAEINAIIAQYTALKKAYEDLRNISKSKADTFDISTSLESGEKALKTVIEDVNLLRQLVRHPDFKKAMIDPTQLGLVIEESKVLNGTISSLLKTLEKVQKSDAFTNLDQNAKAGFQTLLNNLRQTAQQQKVEADRAASILKDARQSLGNMPDVPANFKGYALSLRQLTAEGANISGIFDRVANSLNKTFPKGAAHVEQYRQSIRHLEEELIAFRSGVVTWSMGIQMLGEAILQPVQEAVNHFLVLTDTMGMVKGVMNATGSAFEQLQDTAITWGAVTRFTSQEVATGLLQLGRAGVNAASAIQILPTTLNLAQASGLDLATSSRIATSALRAFELPFEKMPKMADVLTKAITTSNNTLDELGTGFTYVGSLAKGFGIPLEEIVGALAQVGNAGFKSCHDDKTEIMTKDRGFVLFKDLLPEDQVMTINKDTLEMEWQFTDGRIYSYEVDEPLFCIETKSLNYAVTDNHRLFIETRAGVRKIIEAKDFKEGRFFRTGIWKGIDQDAFVLKGFNQDRGSWIKEIPDLEIPMVDWVEFLGWYFSEGSYGYHGGNYTIVICQTEANPEKLKVIENLLSRLPFNFRREKVGFTITNQQLYLELEKYGKGCINLKIPDYVKNLPAEKLRIFYEAFRLGDGDVQNNLITSGKYLVDDLYEIVIKCGYGAQKSLKMERGDKKIIQGREISATTNGWEINVSKCHTKPYVSFAEEERKQNKEIVTNFVGWKPYKGKVYSVKVDNGLVFVRRNGKGLFSGNTLGGTALRGVLDSLFNPTKDEARLMQDLANRIGDTSFSIKKANGEFIGFVELIKKLEQAGLSSDEALRLFGQRAGPGAAALLRIGSGALEEYIDNLKLSEGTTARIGKNAEETLQGRVLIMQSAFEGLQEVFGKSLEAPLRAITDALTVFMNRLLTLHDMLGPVAVVLDRVVAALAALVATIGSATFVWFLMLVPATQFVAFLHVVIGLLAGMTTAHGKATAAAVSQTAAISTLGTTTAIAGTKMVATEAALATMAGGYAAKMGTIFLQLKDIVISSATLIGNALLFTIMKPFQVTAVTATGLGAVLSNILPSIYRAIKLLGFGTAFVFSSLLQKISFVKVALLSFYESLVAGIGIVAKLRIAFFGLLTVFKGILSSPITWLFLAYELFTAISEPVKIVTAELQKQGEQFKAAANNVLIYGNTVQKSYEQLNKFNKEQEKIGGGTVSKGSADLLEKSLVSPKTLTEVSNFVDSLTELDYPITTQIDNTGKLKSVIVDLGKGIDGQPKKVRLYSDSMKDLGEISKAASDILATVPDKLKTKTLDNNAKIVALLARQYISARLEISKLELEIESINESASDTKEAAKQTGKLNNEILRLQVQMTGLKQSMRGLFDGLKGEEATEFLKNTSSEIKRTSDFFEGTRPAIEFVKNLLSETNTNAVLKQSISDSWDKFSTLILQTQGRLKGFISGLKDTNAEIEKSLEEATKAVEKYLAAQKTDVDTRIKVRETIEKEQLTAVETRLKKELALVKENNTDKTKILLETTRLTADAEAEKLRIIQGTAKRVDDLLKENLDERSQLLDSSQSFIVNKEVLEKEEQDIQRSLQSARSSLEEFAKSREQILGKIRAVEQKSFDFKQDLSEIRAAYEARLKGGGTAAKVETELTNLKRRQVEIRKLLDEQEFDNAFKLLERQKDELKKITSDDKALAILKAQGVSIEQILNETGALEKEASANLKNSLQDTLATLNSGIETVNETINRLINSLNQVFEKLLNLSSSNVSTTIDSIGDKTLTTFKKLVIEANKFKSAYLNSTGKLEPFERLNESIIPLISNTRSFKDSISTLTLATKALDDSLKGDNFDLPPKSFASVKTATEKLLGLSKAASNLNIQGINTKEIQDLLDKEQEARKAFEDAAKAVAENKDESSKELLQTTAKQAFNEWNLQISNIKNLFQVISDSSKNYLIRNSQTIAEELENFEGVLKSLKKGLSETGKGTPLESTIAKNIKDIDVLIDGLGEARKIVQDPNFQLNVINSEQLQKQPEFKIQPVLENYEKEKIQRRLKDDLSNLGEITPKLSINTTPAAKKAAKTFTDNFKDYLKSIDLKIPGLDNIKEEAFHGSVIGPNKEGLNDTLVGWRQLEVKSNELFEDLQEQARLGFSRLHTTFENGLVGLSGTFSETSAQLGKDFGNNIAVGANLAVKQLGNGFVYVRKDLENIDFSKLQQGLEGLTTSADTGFKNLHSNIKKIQDSLAVPLVFNDVTDRLNISVDAKQLRQLYETKNFAEQRSIATAKDYADALARVTEKRNQLSEATNKGAPDVVIEVYKEDLVNLEKELENFRIKDEAAFTEAANAVAIYKERIDSVVTDFHKTTRPLKLDFDLQSLDAFKETVNIFKDGVFNKDAFNLQPAVEQVVRLKEKVSEVFAAGDKNLLPVNLATDFGIEIQQANDSLTQYEQTVYKIQELTEKAKIAQGAGNLNSLQTYNSIISELTSSLPELGKKAEESFNRANESTKKVNEELKKSPELTKQIAEATEQAAEQQKKLEEATKRSNEQLVQASDQLSKGVPLVNKGQLENVLATVKEAQKLSKQQIVIPLTVDSKNLNNVTTEIQANIKQLKEDKTPIQLKVEKTATLADITSIYNQARQFAAQGVNISVDFTPRIEELKKKVNETINTLKGKNIDIKVDTDEDIAKRELRSTRREMELLQKMNGSVTIFSDPQVALMDIMVDRLDQMLEALNQISNAKTDDGLEKSITTLNSKFTELGDRIKSALQTAFDTVSLETLRSGIESIKQSVSNLTVLIQVEIPGESAFDSFKRKWDELKNSSPMNLEINVTPNGSALGAKIGGLIPNIQRFAGGGFSRPNYQKVPGSGVGDTVPAMLEPGEFIIRRKAVQKLGIGFLSMLNKSDLLFRNAGGIVSSLASGFRASFTIPQSAYMLHFASGGLVPGIKSGHAVDYVDINLSLDNTSRPVKLYGEREEVMSLVSSLKKLKRGS